jgi:hypothetical protein
MDVYVIAEGPTEQTFIRNLLVPYFGTRNIFLYPVLIGKRGHKGGNVSLRRTTIDVGNFLKQRSDTLVTTMIDYYGLSGEWPERLLSENEKNVLTAVQKAKKVEIGLLNTVQTAHPNMDVANRFIPFFVMHEFEALLFSNPATLAHKLNIPQETVTQILHECREPEEINDSVLTSPSKRLENLVSGSYRKTTQGIAIAQKIGLPQMRAQCPHFDEWLQAIESKVIH